MAFLSDAVGQLNQILYFAKSCQYNAVTWLSIRFAMPAGYGQADVLI